MRFRRYAVSTVYGLIVFVAISSFILFNDASFVSASDSTTTVTTVTVPTACSFSSGGGSYSTSIVRGHTSTITGNTAEIACNDASGYAIYAIGYSGNSYTGNYHTDLINSEDNNYNIKTDGTSGALYWKMKISNLSYVTAANSYDDFQVIPSSSTKIGWYNAAASGSFTPVYQIYVGTSQASGSYNGKIKYILVHPNSISPTYTINYNASGGSGSMTSDTPNSFDDFTLPTSSFTAPTNYAFAYTFAGWCTVQDLSQTPQTTCSGTTYTDGATILADTINAGGTLELYATWRVAPTLYNAVAAMSKGKQTNDANTTTGIQAAITIPTSAIRTEDTSNSGVYEYDPSIFGVSSDASNDYKIYYYRGVLENSVGSYGSDGSAVTYPNYVILQSGSSKATTDTCWRIVRTTGSGGVKMIYNGKWTGSTCANATTNAQVTTSAFNGTSSTGTQIVRAGYTHNSTYATNSYKSDTIAKVFGDNSHPSRNNTRSTIKAYIEDTWYANNMTAYTSILEASAGYCNDRTMNKSQGWTSPIAESTTIETVYVNTDLQIYYFGAYPRNYNAAQAPTLTCATKGSVDRSIVDLYRYVANSTGVSNELKYPAALLTADELSFAGSGRSTVAQGSSYHANSFLRSGSRYWLLSPFWRYTRGSTVGCALDTTGELDDYYVYSEYGVRPAISLAPGTAADSGSGIATDPWVVTAP